MRLENQPQEQTEGNAPSGQSVIASPNPESGTVREVAEVMVVREKQTAETTEAADRLAVLLLQERKKRKNAYFIWIGVLWSYALIGLFFISPWIKEQGISAILANRILLYLILLIGIGLPIYWKRSKKLLRAPGWEDKRLVGPLIEAYTQRIKVFGKQEQRLIQHSLARLLSRLTVNDASLLNDVQRTALKGILKNNGYIGWQKFHDPELMEAAIQAFTQIGDARCLPQVRELAQYAKQERVREAAQSSLPTLQALSEEQHAGDSLLRAAAAPTHHLLRPAQSGMANEPQELLRAGEKEE